MCVCVTVRVVCVCDETGQLFEFGSGGGGLAHSPHDIYTPTTFTLNDLFPNSL